MRDYLSRCLIVAAALVCSCLSVPRPALAIGTAVLAGTVTFDAAPVSGATITATGNNVRLETHTDAQGRFAFTSLGVGSYHLQVDGQGTATSFDVDLTASGATLAIELHPREIGRALARSSSVRGSGTDLTLNQTQLTRTPASTNFPSLLLQLPGAARGANGVVHINGDHGDINYIVDGVPIPQELNRDIGTEFDLANVSFIDVIEGAYPAQYGERFASVINVSTRTGTGAPGLSGSLDSGSFGLINGELSAHERLGAGALVVALRSSRSNRALDPPNFDSPHDRGSDLNQFVRLTMPHGLDYLNVTFSHSYQTYQLPVDVAAGEPAGTDDNETQDDTFAALQYRHAIGDHGLLSFGPAFKVSHIRDFGDLANDFTFGENLNVEAGGSATDCANALTTPAVYTILTCGYSLNGDRTARDERFNLDYVVRSSAHDVRAGAAYDATGVAKIFAVTLQPNNFLSGLLTPSTPGAPGASRAPYTVVDRAPNSGHTQEAYLQDSWRMGTGYQVDYGVRMDAFQLASSEFQNAASQISPRIKVTRLFGERSSAYVYYGRFFTPFSFENVSPSAAQTLNLPLQQQVAAFDLRPQRDSVYEVGGHLPLGSGDLGVRVTQRNATDLIDDTQVGVTLLHQDINFQRGRIATQSAYYQVPMAREGRFYASINHTYSVNKGCETQLLAPCFGSPTDWTPADHEQRWGVTAGMLRNDASGGWFSADGEYGSGLSSASCPAGTPGFCKRTPHVVFDAEKGFAIRPGTAITLRIGNVFNDRYMITLQNAQGNHFTSGRSIDLGLRFQ